MLTMAQRSLGSNSPIEHMWSGGVIDASNDWTFNLIEGTTHVVGSFGLLWVVSDTVTPSTLDKVPGWTAIGVADYGCYCTLYTRIMDGSETTVSSSGYLGAYTTALVTFLNFADPGHYDLATVAIGASGFPDPPSVSSVEDDDIVMVFGGLDDDAVTLTVSSGFTTAVATGITGGSSAAIGYKLNPGTGTVNPGAFTAGAGSDQWVAYTMRISPLYPDRGI